MNETLNHDLDLRCINTARILSVDMSEKAHSGHPGLPLGAAPMGMSSDWIISARLRQVK